MKIIPTIKSYLFPEPEKFDGLFSRASRMYTIAKSFMLNQETNAISRKFLDISHQNKR
jgi:hypothetical protein